MLAGFIFALCVIGPRSDKRVEDRGAPAFEHFVRGEIFRERGDLARAEAELRYALVFDHDSAYLRSALGTVLDARAQSLQTKP
jgi:hypothetical protein